MRAFLIVGNQAVTEPFNLNSLSNAGRFDILCRCVAQTLFISHNIRKNSEIYLLLLGPPSPPKSVLIESSEVRSMSPDERSIAGLIVKALKLESNKCWKRSSPGVYISNRGLDDLLHHSGYKIVYMTEEGEDMRELMRREKLKDCLFILGDHLGVDKKHEELIKKHVWKSLSVSPLSLQADQCITIINYELDRDEHKKRIVMGE